MTTADLSIAWRQKLPAVHKLVLIYIADASGVHGAPLNLIDLSKIGQFAGTTTEDADAAIKFLLAADHIRHWFPGEGEAEYYQVQQPPR